MIPSKNNTPKVQNNYGPVFLTSLVMSFEKTVTYGQDSTLSERRFTPSRVYYCTGRYCRLALKSSQNHAKLLFVDFSSAFNTTLAGWILDFLSNRTQRMGVNEGMSGACSSSTAAAPQGCVLSQVLYILYTESVRWLSEPEQIYPEDCGWLICQSPPMNKVMALSCGWLFGGAKTHSLNSTYIF